MVYKTDIFHNSHLSLYKNWKQNLKIDKYSSPTIALSKGTDAAEKVNVLIEIKC